MRIDTKTHLYGTAETNLPSLLTYLSERASKYKRSFEVNFGDGQPTGLSIAIEALRDYESVFLREEFALQAHPIFKMRDHDIQRPDSARPVRKLRPKALYTPDRARLEKFRLTMDAKEQGWSASKLRAKIAWVTMRTHGWKPGQSPSPMAISAA